MSIRARQTLAKAVSPLLIFASVAFVTLPARADQTLHYTVKKTTATRPSDSPLNVGTEGSETKKKSDDEVGWTTTVVDTDEHIVLQPQSIALLSKDSAVYYDFDKNA